MYAELAHLTRRSTDPAQEDIYLLAMFLFHLYNPEKPIPKFSGPPTPASAGSLPKSLFPLWKRMLNPNARTRLSTINFVAEAQSTSFWTGNPLVSLVEGLDGFELRSDGEKQQLLRIIKDAADAGTLPEPFLVHRVLPSLLHSLSLPDAPSALMLPLVLAIGKTVPPSTYPKVVLEPVVKLYASPDRGTRMALLEGLNEYADKLDSRTVNERVWPNLITGFADTVPVIREATIKAVYPLSSKVRAFARGHADVISCLTESSTMTCCVYSPRCSRMLSRRSEPTHVSCLDASRRRSTRTRRRRSSCRRSPAV